MRGGFAPVLGNRYAKRSDTKTREFWDINNLYF